MTPAPYLQLASGARFDLTGPPSPLDVRDVAHQLAHICRFAGATRAHYSVAQHSVIVSRLMQRDGAGPDECLAGLLHDAHEIAISDIPRPTKWCLAPAFRDALAALERNVDRRIYHGLGLPGLSVVADACHHKVVAADLLALAHERRDLMAPTTDEWPGVPAPTYPHRIIPSPADRAATFFLARFAELTGRALS